MAKPSIEPIKHPDMNWFIPFIIVYGYSVLLTMYIAYQENPKPKWILIIPGSIFWPLTLAGFVLWFLYMAITHLPARWYKRWKYLRSDEYKAKMRRMDEYYAEQNAKWVDTLKAPQGR